MSEEFKVELGIGLNQTELRTVREQIDSLENNPVQLQLGIRDAENQIDSIRRQIQDLNRLRINLNLNTGGGNGGGGNFNNFNRTISQIGLTVNNTDDAIDGLRRTLGSLNFDNNSIDLVTRNLQEMDLAITRVQHTLRGDTLSLNVTGIDNSTNRIVNIIRELNTETNQITEVSRRITQSFDLTREAARQTNAAYREMKTLIKEIGDTSININKAKDAGQNFDALELKLISLNNRYEELRTNFEDGFDANQTRNLANEWENVSRNIIIANENIANAKAKFAEGIITKFDNKDFEREIDEVVNGVKRLSVESDKATIDTNSLSEAVGRIGNAISSGDVDRIKSSYEEYVAILKRAKNELAMLNKTEKQNSVDVKLVNDRVAFQQKIDVWLKKNSKAAKQFGSQLKNLKAQAENCDRVTLDRLKGEFQQIDKAAELAGKKAMTLTDRIEAQIRKYSSYISVATVFYQVSRAMTSMYNQVVEIDTAMTDLKKVTDETDAAYSRFLDNANEKAQELGRSVSSYIQQTANWAKMGYNVNQSSELAKVSSIYANVADVDDDTAVSDIVTAMKAFNIEAENAVSIVDPLNQLSNEFAVTAAGLGQGLSRAASTMATSGTDLEHTLALLTGISEITQSPEEAGNFLKTAIARIQGMKGTLEELGEEVDESVDSISKVQTQILNLTGGKVNIFDDEGNFRDYYYIMEDIAAVVDELESTDRAQLYEILFGKNRMNQGAAMLQAFQSDQIGNALKSATNSVGSAAAEQQKYMESLEYSLGRLSAAWQGLSETFMDSDFLKFAINSLTGFVNVLEKVVDKVGVIGLLSTAGGLGLFIKHFQTLKNLGDFSQTVKGLTDISSLIKTLGDSKSFIGIFKLTSLLNDIGDSTDLAKIPTVIKNLAPALEIFKNNQGNDKAIEGVKNALAGLSQESKLAALSVFNLSEKQAAAILSSMGLKDAELQAAVATVASGTAAKGAAFSFTAFGAAVKTAAAGLWTFLATNPVGWAILAAGAIFGAVKVFDALTESMDEAKEKADESKQAYETTASEVQSLNSELEATKNRIKELESQGTLTITEDEELTKLKSQREELEQQLAIKEKLAAYQQKEAAKDAANVLTKETSYETGKYKEISHSGRSSQGEITTTVKERKYGDIIDQTKDKQILLNEKTEEYNALLEEQSKLEPDYSKWFEADTVYEQNEEKLKTLEEELDTIEGEINDNLSEISNQYFTLFDENGKVIVGFEDTAKRAANVINYVTDSSEGFVDAQGKNANAIKKTGIAIVDVSDNVEEYTKQQQVLTEALDASKSATGLTAQQVKDLTNQYKDLKNFDAVKLFEQTENGIHLNEEAFKELNEEFEKKKLQEYASEIERLERAIGDAIIAGEDASVLENELRTVKQLQSEFEGLTSAYNKWIKAKSGGNERDSYAGIGEGYSEMKEIYDSGWYGDESLNAYLDLLLSAQERTGNAKEDFKKLNETISGTSHSLMDYWQFDDETDQLVTDGLFDFLDDVKKKLGEEYVEIDNNGKYLFDFTGEKLQKVADEFGTTTEVVQLFEKALIDASMAVNMGDTESIETLKTRLESVNTLLKEINEEPVDINLYAGNLDDVGIAIEQAKTMIRSLTEEDGTLKLGVEQSDYNDALYVLSHLINRKAELEAPALMLVKIDTSEAATEADKALGLLKELKSASTNLELQTAVGADTTEAQNKIQSIVGQIEEIPPKVQTALGLDDTEFQTAVANLKNTKVNTSVGANLNPEDLAIIDNTLNNITAEMTVNAGVDETEVDAYLAKDKNTTSILKVELDDKELDDYLNTNYNRSSTHYINVIERTTSSHAAIDNADNAKRGASRVNGTAFARGNWRTNKTEKALVGEEGREIVVTRNNQWYTVGDFGAEFVTIPKDSIVFNATQTEQLLTNGKITFGNTRGRAFLSGTAYKDSSKDSGSGGGRRDGGSTTTGVGDKAVEDSIKKSADKLKEEFEKVFDWIPRAIERIERTIERLDRQANNVYKNWDSRNNALTQQISKVREEINLQNAAAERYEEAAKSVGLAESWAKKVREGTIDVETIDNEVLAEKIEKYQEWYDKAIDAKMAVEELQQTELELYEQRFHNVEAEYEAQLAVFEFKKSMLDEAIAQTEASGYLVSGKYYEALIANENKNIDKLKAEREDLIKAMKELEAAGMEVHSEKWYELANAIDDVTLSIMQGETELKKYANAIREIEWSITDLFHENISEITKEAEFLIDLMSNDKLHTDKGQLTAEGQATMGLHGMNFNTLMYQSDKYKESIKELNDEIAKDPYNQDLIERRNELLELQRDAILNAEQEKQAIVDLVEEGINLELDSLQELIDKYGEALDSRKDLYEYEKSIAEKTKNISSLEKQLSAFSGDNSEESQKRIQEIKAQLGEAKGDLADFEYDKYVSDQKALLDDLYLSYEETLNTRLDDTSALIQDMIANLNTNAESINTTLSEKAGEVGITISQNMDNIWQASTSELTTVLTTYGTGIQGDIASATTTLNATLNAIDLDIKEMIKQLEKEASSTISYIGSSSYTDYYDSYTPSTPSTPETPKADEPAKPATSTTGSSNKGGTTVKKGDTVNMGNASIYDYKGDKSGEHQYYYKDPVYTVLQTSSDGKWIQVRQEDLNSGVSGWFKTEDIKKSYATGAKRIAGNQTAWTQEKGQEFIIRPSDGAILTPLAQGDSVLNADASRNIWDMANTPEDFIKENLKLDMVGVPTGTTNQQVQQNFDNITFHLPNVRNYNELVLEMQRDPKFEKLITAMTIDRVAGGSSLAKSKAIR